MAHPIGRAIIEPKVMDTMRGAIGSRNTMTDPVGNFGGMVLHHGELPESPVETPRAVLTQPADERGTTLMMHV